MVTAFGVAVLTALGVGCGGATETRALVTIPPPVRTAAENAQIRFLLLELAAAKVCDSLEGSFLALPDRDAEVGASAGRSPAAGRLWVQACRASLEMEEGGPGALALQLAGPGWTWMEESSDGPLGSSFLLRGHLRFQAAIGLTGALDISYDARRRVVTFWMTPDSAAQVLVTPLGAVPVTPAGGWSSVVASIGGWVGPSLEERAAPMIEEQGSRRMAERLQTGFTFTIDLCSGQFDLLTGALAAGNLPERPFPAGAHRWQVNQRARLRPGGLEVSGPFPATGHPLRVDIQVEHGEPIRLGAYCLAEGHRLVLHHLMGSDRQRDDEPAAPEAVWRARLRPGPSRAFQLPAAPCDLMLFAESTVPQAAGVVTETVFRYRVFDESARNEALISCPPKGT